jgi:hypothetical protein
MKFFLRSFFIWLAIFAIPVQGFAGATMLLCGPSHHSVSSASMKPVATEMQHAHGKHGHTQSQQSHHAHHSSDEAKTVVTAVNTDAVPTQSPSLKQLKAKCSACAYCCMAAFMPSRETTLAVTHEPSAPIAYQTSAFVGFEPDTFERPPRSLLI